MEIISKINMELELFSEEREGESSLSLGTLIWNSSYLRERETEREREM